MARDREIDEQSDWEREYDNAFDEEKRKRGLEGVPDEELSEEIFKEIDEAAKEQVGPDPDEDS